MVENVENILVLLSQQNYLDITVYVFIVYFLFLGWKRGAIYQIYYLFSLLMAISLSFRYSFDIGLYISNWLNSNLQLSEIFGGTLVFIAVLTFASFFQNLVKNFSTKADFGGKLLGVGISIVLSNLILTLIFTGITLTSIPQQFKSPLQNSNLVNFYIDPEGSPQQTLELIIGTDLLKVVNRINELTGKSSVVIEEDGCLEIPKYSQSVISENTEFAVELYNQIAYERESENVDGLELNQLLSDVAIQYAKEMYVEGFWCHKNPFNGEVVTDRLSKVGFPYKVVGENLAIASSVRAGHNSLMESESHRNTILDNEFRRVGIGVVSGPLGLIIVQVFS